MTVASASTHHAGGPSHALHEAADSTAVESTEPLEAAAKAAEEALSNVSEMMTSLGTMIPEVGSPKGDAGGNGGQYKAPNKGLDDEEKRGLWILGGIIGLGWLIGGPKKDKKKKKIDIGALMGGDDK